MKNKLLGKYTISLMVFGLAVNLLLARIVTLLSLPLFLDSIGTILVAALGGFLPGVAVGFFSNFITAIIASDPVTCYYGIISILLAIAASEFSRRGLLKKAGGALLAVLIFALIGGGGGSILTWILYGFSFGEGVSAPYAYALLDFGFPKFWAQFTADMLIDIADKFISMAVIFPLLRFFPKKYTDVFPLGYVYEKQYSFSETVKKLKDERLFRKRSLRSKITALIMTVTVFLSVIALYIGTSIYKESLISENETICTSVVEIMKNELDGNDMNRYLSEGESAEGYSAVKEFLTKIKNDVPDIEYIYVYQIREDGCHVIFDIDTEEVEGDKPGAVIDFDPAFEKYLPQLLSGNEIEPIISNDTYGWLMTVYSPVYDSDGSCTAYAAADLGMDSISVKIIDFVTKMTAMLLCSFIAITVFSIWYCELKVIEPIGVLVERARGFEYKETPASERRKRLIPKRDVIRTGDELEEVYESMCRTEKEIAGYVSEISEKNGEISQMQRNIIYSLADMVENRDVNTGEHVKRTSEYVKIIGERLCETDYENGAVTPEMTDMLSASAPLHDIGKIKISDAILNKPGKLTPEEFEIMKTHTVAGRDILLSSLTGIRDGGYIAMAADMAAYHHERWDGRGYPDGLSGKSIPLCARIMAVADVFDALTSKRSYKEAMCFDTAMKIIREESGTHFDPDIVDAFCAESEKTKIVMKL